MRRLLKTLLGLQGDDQVVCAQIKALKPRVPFLYLMISGNVVLLSYTHIGTGAAWKIILLPALFVLGMISRTVWWIRLPVASMSPGEAKQIRDRTIILGGVIGLALYLWAFSLFGSGPPVGPGGYLTGDGHVVFFVGVSVVGSIFLLMHIRAAAILLSLIVVVPFAASLMVKGTAIEHAIAINLLIVCLAMLYVAISFARDFEKMISTEEDLRCVSSLNARLAAADVVTALPNRRRFFEELNEVAASGRDFAVIVIDLDGFKQVNDLYGHVAGDSVLVEIASRIAGLFPSACCVARMGGDEFGCLIPEQHIADAEAYAGAAIAACATPIVQATFTAHVGASAGLVFTAARDATAAEAYELADYALYKAKRNGRGKLEVFSTDDQLSMRRDSRIGRAMRSPDFLSQLSTVYQPIVRSGIETVSAFEVLVRWHHAELGFVPPNDFIPHAERTDLIFDVSRFVLGRALADAQAWPEAVGLKVNLSVRDLMSTDQIRRLIGAVTASSIAPARITFEITESIFADSLAQVRHNVDLLRAAGCAVAIDDFGVGYSSLNYIHALAPNVIKIDRCFVDSLMKQASAQRIVCTILELARNVGARSVAEGVETEEQARLLAQLGCDELQGYFFSRPLSAGDAERTIGSFPRASAHPDMSVEPYAAVA